MDQADPAEAVRMLDLMLVFFGDVDTWTKARSTMAAAASATSARRLESHSIGEADWKKQLSLAARPMVSAAISMQDLTALYIVDILRGLSVRGSPAREYVGAVVVVPTLASKS